MGIKRQKRASTIMVDPSSGMDIFSNFERWNETYIAYADLRKEKKTPESIKRLRKLRKQVVIQYLKNFLYFPLLIIRFFKPAYMKGSVTAWDNIKTLSRLLVSREFRPLRTALLSQVFFVCAFIYFGTVAFHRYAAPVYAATYGWIMTDWSGGASTTLYATHASNQTGWTYFYSKDASINTSVAGEVSLVISVTTSTETTDTDFNAGTKTRVYVPTSTNSFKLLKRDGATCTTGAECLGGGCNGSNKCYTTP